LALITLLVYWPVRNAGFVVFDDPDYVTNNSHVQAGLTWSGVKWAFTTWNASNWHPVTWLSHMVDASLFGPNPGAQHFINVLLHTANVLLLFLFLFRTTSKVWPAAFVAALFAWHPLHVESVAWISERKDVLSTFFGLLSLLAYVRYAEEDEVQNPKRKTWRIIALVLFAVGLMAKPMLVTLPFVMLLLDVWPLGRFHGLTSSEQRRARDKRLAALIAEKIPFFVLTVASCLVTFFAQRGEAVMSLEQRPLGLRLANAVVAYVEYLGKTIWPAKLAVIYPLPHQIPAWEVAGAAVVLLALTVGACVCWKRGPYLVIGWLWFVGTLVPVIGLVQVGGQSLADRYTYIPLIGIFVGVAYGVAELAPRYRIPRVQVSVAAGLVLAGCLFGTERQVGFWQSSETLFRRAIEVTKNNAIAHINLGVALEQKDLREDALAEYHQAIDIDPNRFQAHNNLANLLSDVGDRTNAAREYETALRLNPKALEAHLNFGTLLSEIGRFDEAMHEYTTAAQLVPDDPRPYYLMGKACLRHGQSAEAVKHFHEALQIAPNDLQALKWLARVLAADNDAMVRYAKDAISLAQRANELTGGEDPFVLDTLGMAYAEGGRFKEAQDTVQKAIELKSAGAKEVDPRLQERLQLYQSSRPYREDFSKTLSVSK
jgi:Flp pilus assembly protein TadD